MSRRNRITAAIRTAVSEESFLREWRESGRDPDALLIFADWLEEKGDQRADILRWAVEDDWNLIQVVSDWFIGKRVDDNIFKKLSVWFTTRHRHGESQSNTFEPWQNFQLMGMEEWGQHRNKIEEEELPTWSYREMLDRAYGIIEE